MDLATVLYDKTEHVATITLNRPEALNAFNSQLRADFDAALREAQNDKEVRVVIVTGAGRAFSAGSDLQERSAASAAEPPSPLVTVEPLVGSVTDFIMDMTKPVIVAFQGPAVGMGATIPLACDLRIMADTARIGFVFVKRGITPEFGSTYLLPRIVGQTKAREILLTGRFVDAKEALEIGLVNQVVPADQLMDAAMKLAKEIATAAPLAVAFTKRGLNLSYEGNLRSVVQFERWAFPTCTRSEDFREGVRAFMEKREPQFKGR